MHNVYVSTIVATTETPFDDKSHVAKELERETSAYATRITALGFQVQEVGMLPKAVK